MKNIYFIGFISVFTFLIGGAYAQDTTLCSISYKGTNTYLLEDKGLTESGTLSYSTNKEPYCLAPNRENPLDSMGKTVAPLFKYTTVNCSVPRKTPSNVPTVMGNKYIGVTTINKIKLSKTSWFSIFSIPISDAVETTDAIFRQDDSMVLNKKETFACMSKLIKSFNNKKVTLKFTYDKNTKKLNIYK